MMTKLETEESRRLSKDLLTSHTQSCTPFSECMDCILMYTYDSTTMWKVLTKKEEKWLHMDDQEGEKKPKTKPNWVALLLGNATATKNVHMQD